MEYLKIDASRDAYAPHQLGCNGTCTVRELIDTLEGFDEELPVFLSHDNGYTFGGISLYDMEVLEDEG